MLYENYLLLTKIVKAKKSVRVKKANDDKKIEESELEKNISDNVHNEEKKDL